MSTKSKYRLVNQLLRKRWLSIFDGEGGLVGLAKSYERFGLKAQANGDITLVEWAPCAKAMSIFGEFNNWNRREFWAQKNEFGCFVMTIKANDDGTPRIKHG